MKIQIKLIYENKVYVSSYQEVTGQERRNIIDLIEKVVEGKALHFTFTNGDQKYYFGKDILAKSIITIETVKNL